MKEESDSAIEVQQGASAAPVSTYKARGEQHAMDDSRNKGRTVEGAIVFWDRHKLVDQWFYILNVVCKGGHKGRDHMRVQSRERTEGDAQDSSSPPIKKRESANITQTHNSTKKRQQQELA